MGHLAAAHVYQLLLLGSVHSGTQGDGIEIWGCVGVGVRVLGVGGGFGGIFGGVWRVGDGMGFWIQCGGRDLRIRGVRWLRYIYQPCWLEGFAGSGTGV